VEALVEDRPAFRLSGSGPDRPPHVFRGALGGLDPFDSVAEPITRGMNLFLLKPLIAACLAIWILAQPVTWLQWRAIAVICGAVALQAAWPRVFGQPAAVRTP
jgi:hypothetical protein